MVKGSSSLEEECLGKKRRLAYFCLRMKLLYLLRLVFVLNDVLLLFYFPSNMKFLIFSCFKTMPLLFIYYLCFRVRFWEIV